MGQQAPPLLAVQAAVGDFVTTGQHVIAVFGDRPVPAQAHLGDVLRLLGSTSLHGPLTFRDREGAPRLLMPGRTWEDYLTLGVTEIREYGSGSIQVVRRLRALLEDLQEAVRPENRPAVDAEIAKLDLTVAVGFADSVDKDQAQVPDRQGIGGPAASTASSRTAREGTRGVGRAGKAAARADGPGM